MWFCSTHSLAVHSTGTGEGSSAPRAKQQQSTERAESIAEPVSSATILIQTKICQTLFILATDNVVTEMPQKQPQENTEVNRSALWHPRQILTIHLSPTRR